MRVNELAQHPVVAIVAEAFAGAATDLFLVGGSVRDAMAGAANFADLDFTTSAGPPRIRALVANLGPVWDAGERFGTIGVSVPAGTSEPGCSAVKVEITTFRTETYEAGSRKPQVGFGDRVEEDLRRRDLTINAAALCLVSDGRHAPGSLVDPFGGASDLAAGVLRTPDEAARTMEEDPLRQLRVVRFAVTRSMKIAPELSRAICSRAGRLEIVSRERVRDELLKIATFGPRALASALRLAEELGIVEHLAGGLATPAGIEALERLEPTASLEQSLATLAALAEGSEASMRHLKLSNELRIPSLELAAMARQLNAHPTDELAARRLVRRYENAVLQRAQQVAVALVPEVSADALREQLPSAAAIAARLRAPLPINGDALVRCGLRGKEVGNALLRALDAFLANPTLDSESVLAAALGSGTDETA